MGGITVDVSKLTNDYEQLRILPDAILFLAREGVFVDITPAVVSDKSKADLIRKALVCIQVTWFTIQCIERKVADYPLALLEIHTMVHVVCALFMYILWWKVNLGVTQNCVLAYIDKETARCLRANSLRYVQSFGCFILADSDLKVWKLAPN